MRMRSLMAALTLAAGLAGAAVVNVRDYGATGNGATDDTAAIQAAANAAGTNGGIVNFPAGTYAVSIVQVRPGATFQTKPGDARAVIRTKANSGKFVRCFTTTQYPYSGAADSAPLVFDNLEFDGNLANQGPYQNYELEHQAGIFAAAASTSPGRLTFEVRNCSFHDGAADAIGISDNVHATITNCAAFEYFRGGITAGSGGTEIHITDFTSGGITNRAGLQIEVDSAGYNGNKAIDITANNVDLDGGFDVGFLDGGTFTASNILLRKGPFFLLAKGAAVRIRDSVFYAGSSSRSHLYYPTDTEFANCRFIVSRESDDAVSNYSPTRVYFNLASGEARSNQVCAFRNCAWEMGTGFRAGDIRTAVYVSADRLSAGNRLVIDGGTIAPGYEYGVSVEQGGAQAITNLQIGAAVAVELGATSSFGDYYLDTLLDGVSFVSGVATSECLVWDSPSNHITHVNMVVDETMNRLGSSYGLTANTYHGGRLVRGGAPPVNAPGLLGDRYRLKTPVPGQPAAWRCTVSHLTAATWQADSNRVPEARPGLLSAWDNQAPTGTLSGADSDGDSLTFSVVSGPGHGAVSITNAATGGFRYAPAAGFSGRDAFAFKANDGQEDSNIATQTVVVRARNVAFLCRAQTAYTNVCYYGSATNDGAAFLATLGYAGSSGRAKGNQHTGPHDYSGGSFADALLGDGMAISLKAYANDDFTVWDPATGRLLFTNNLGGASYTYDHVAPLPALAGLAGGAIPNGSLVALDDYSSGDAIAVFERGSTNFALRFRVGLGVLLHAGLTMNADYFGESGGNRYLACSLSNGTIVAGCTGKTNVWLINPGSGSFTNDAVSPEVGLLQGILALPEGEIGFVGSNRAIRCYRPAYAGTNAPVLGPVVRAADIPATHGSWVTDACAFRDGTVGLLIGRGQYPAGDGVYSNAINATKDVVERWDLEGNFLGSFSSWFDRCGHVAGDSAVPFFPARPRGTVLIVR